MKRLFVPYDMSSPRNVQNKCQISRWIFLATTIVSSMPSAWRSQATRASLWNYMLERALKWYKKKVFTWNGTAAQIFHLLARNMLRCVCAHDGWGVSAWVLAAAVSVIGKTIVSTLYVSTIEWTFWHLVRLHNTTSYPRETHPRSFTVDIMWTTTSQSGGTLWVPNHFLPLLWRQKAKNRTCHKGIGTLQE